MTLVRSVQLKVPDHDEIVSKCNKLKYIVSISGELRLLQIISEPITLWCVNEDVVPLKQVDCKISRQLYRETMHSL